MKDLCLKQGLSYILLLQDNITETSFLKMDHVSHVDVRETRVRKWYVVILEFGEVYLHWSQLLLSVSIIGHNFAMLIILILFVHCFGHQSFQFDCECLGQSQALSPITVCCLKQELHSPASSVMTVSRCPKLLSFVQRPFTPLIQKFCPKGQNTSVWEKLSSCKYNIICSTPI